MYRIRFFCPISNKFTMPSQDRYLAFKFVNFSISKNGHPLWCLFESVYAALIHLSTCKQDTKTWTLLWHCGAQKDEQCCGAVNYLFANAYIDDYSPTMILIQMECLVIASSFRLPYFDSVSNRLIKVAHICFKTCASYCQSAKEAIIAQLQIDKLIFCKSLSLMQILTRVVSFVTFKHAFWSNVFHPTLQFVDSDIFLTPGEALATGIIKFWEHFNGSISHYDFGVGPNICLWLVSLGCF